MNQVTVTKVAHLCENRLIEADVEPDRYWWGYIDGIKLKLAISRCPLCGDRLPTKEVANA